MSTIVYTLNMVQVKKGTHKTSCELCLGHPPLVCYFKVFGRKCSIERDEYQGNFESKSDEGIFLLDIPHKVRLTGV